MPAPIGFSNSHGDRLAVQDRDWIIGPRMPRRTNGEPTREQRRNYATTARFHDLISSQQRIRPPTAFENCTLPACASSYNLSYIYAISVETNQTTVMRGDRSVARAHTSVSNQVRRFREKFPDLPKLLQYRYKTCFNAATKPTCGGSEFNES